jgi:hypothetical protein
LSFPLKQSSTAPS